MTGRAEEPVNGGPSPSPSRTTIKAKPRTNGSSSSKLRILVTGGAGFVGSHLCDHLVRLGHMVICLDNFFTGSKDRQVRIVDILLDSAPVYDADGTWERMAELFRAHVGTIMHKKTSKR